MASVSLKGIVKHYDKTPVIHGIDLDIADGEFMVFVGPSGCGKSTLLRMIAGLETISDGTLHIGGVLANDIAPAQRKLAMVFQSYALYPHMTVFENMAFALKLAGRKPGEVQAAVERAAAILQITPLLKRKPKELSGGQRQRVAIGRAIVRKPEVFLFDEPLSNLDASLRVQMRVELSRLHGELKTTMIYVTHDQVEAMTLGQRIVVFNGGRIEQVGTPHELYNAPANLFVAGFLGTPKMNFIPGEIVAADDTYASLRLSGGGVVKVATVQGVSVGDQVTLGVRAEHLSIASQQQDNVIDVGIGHVEYLGDQSIAYATLAGLPEMIAVKQPAEAAPLHAGGRARVHLPPARCLLFNSSGQALRRDTVEFGVSAGFV
ncbi:sn-glycerol-3-phosphate ABC transporter ATP-binding protein UgpC [Duganella dendranthematis]|jgi:multiple sugar transport system ATP-binding protein|uniref:Sn-glycerol-3-phosphate ABC transporter ATP-binding protein UgpC n=1 Tax=Duganella dendranthematis TaxID=2728021 RepID=A0ABX6MCA7_9BURK|nr:sn-glycerol-3-phosphate ABC transporter ATP-binding protein UgpC [Duganella dendranthematis]QJD91948.1 sn-glycerol-3-phosphate ABC transporter ATP-binding protein UgpC [Duganella dendranthematis]